MAYYAEHITEIKRKIEIIERVFETDKLVVASPADDAALGTAEFVLDTILDGIRAEGVNV